MLLTDYKSCMLCAAAARWAIAYRGEFHAGDFFWCECKGINATATQILLAACCVNEASDSLIQLWNWPRGGSDLNFCSVTTDGWFVFLCHHVWHVMCVDLQIHCLIFAPNNRVRLLPLFKLKTENKPIFDFEMLNWESQYGCSCVCVCYVCAAKSKVVFTWRINM